MRPFEELRQGLSAAARDEVDERARKILAALPGHATSATVAEDLQPCERHRDGGDGSPVGGCGCVIVYRRKEGR